MAYELAPDEEFEIAAFAEVWANDRVALANQFNRSLITNYVAQYENFWSIGRSDVTTQKLNAGLQRLDGVGLLIIAHAGKHVSDLKNNLGDAFPDKYLLPPRPYVLKNITFADGYQVAELATFIEFWALVQQHGLATAGYVEVGELLPEWSE